MDAIIIPQNEISNDPGAQGALSPMGDLLIKPASFYEKFTPSEIPAFCVMNGLYSLVTEELVAWLKGNIDPARTLEIGAGNGVLAQALQVRAVDNHMQTWPEIRATYLKLRQATVRYGANVENIDAAVAIAASQPDVVIACWLTHKYNPADPSRGGNEHGVDETAILKQCKTYVHVGNSFTHRNKPIRNLQHRTYRFPWLFSRAFKQELNEILVWGEKLPMEP